MANAGYRQIHPEIWSDPWFLELTPNQKLIFIYMFSNDRSSLSGLYEISIKQISFQTGIPEDEIAAFIDKCQQDKKIIRHKNIFFVVNLLKRHFSNSAKVLIRIKKDIDSIQDCEPKRVCIEKYSEMIGYRYPIDTHTSKDKDEDEDEVKDKDEVNTTTPFSELSRVFIEKTGLPELTGGPKNYLEALREMVDLGVTHEILETAIDEMADKGWSITSPRSLLNPCKVVISRENAKKNHKKQQSTGKEFTADQILGAQ